MTIKGALERVKSIQWSSDYSICKSHNYLALEYLRRITLWQQYIQVESETWPFFDVVQEISPKIKVPETIITSFEEYCDTATISSFAERICSWYLRWVTYIEQGSTPSEPPPPYEPLIILYERGGTLRTEHGYLCVGLTRFVLPPNPLFKKDRKQRLVGENYQVDLSQNFLDQLDQSDPEISASNA